MRLVDADEFESYLINRYGGNDTGDEIIEDLTNQPTIDAVERKRGEWMFSPDDAEGVCSICQYKIYARPYQGRYLIVPYNFCPNCGAEMRGENNG